MDIKKIQEAVARFKSEHNVKKIEKDTKVQVRKGAFDISDFKTQSQHMQGLSSTDMVLFKKRADCNDEEKKFQDWNDDCLFVAVALAKQGEQLENVVSRLNIYKSWRLSFGTTSELAKAMDTTTSGSGLEWIPTNFSSQIIEKVQLELKVASRFMTINMPTDPFKISGVNSFPAAKLGSENTAPTTTTVGSRNITLDAKKLIVDIPFSFELEEDAAFALLPLIREQIVNALARSIEDGTINGDTAGTHQDADVTAADDPRKAWNGLRKNVLGAAKVDVSTFNWEKLVGIGGVRQKMGIFGADPTKAFWLTGTAGFAHLVTLKDSNNNPVVTRVNEFGAVATAKTGVVGILGGSDVVVSEFVREDLDSNGVHTASPTNDTKTIILNTRMDAFMYGDRRSLRVDQDVDISAQTRNIVASLRKAFEARLDAANLTVIGLGRNLATS